MRSAGTPENSKGGPTKRKMVSSYTSLILQLDATVLVHEMPEPAFLFALFTLFRICLRMIPWTSGRTRSPANFVLSTP